MLKSGQSQQPTEGGLLDQISRRLQELRREISESSREWADLQERIFAMDAKKRWAENPKSGVPEKERQQILTDLREMNERARAARDRCEELEAEERALREQSGQLRRQLDELQCSEPDTARALQSRTERVSSALLTLDCAIEALEQAEREKAAAVAARDRYLASEEEPRKIREQIAALGRRLNELELADKGTARDLDTSARAVQEAAQAVDSAREALDRAKEERTTCERALADTRRRIAELKGGEVIAEAVAAAG